MSQASPQRLRRRRVWRVATVVVVAVLAAWSVVIEPRSLRVVEYDLTLEQWPDECGGLRVAVLSDLHVGSPFHGAASLGHLVDLVQSARPDLILLAGDYVIHNVPGGTFVPPADIADGLRALQAPMGVWAVLGNHDWWYDARLVREAFEGVGIRVLEDASAEATAGTCRLWLTGIGDYWEGDPDIPLALGTVPGDATVVAFTHNPDVFPGVPPRVSLTVAGHTHGGQVSVPFYGPPVVPSIYGRRYAEGHMVEGGRHLFVTPGIGTSILPVRFRVPPEVSLLVLHAAR